MKNIILKFITLGYLSSILFTGCAQQTIEPTVVNTHNLRVQSIKPTGSVSPNVLIALYEDQQATKLLSQTNATTGASGVFNAKIDIPTFGHSYLLNAKKYYPSGTLLEFSKTYWPLTLKCADTTVTIIIPEADTSIIRDTICSANGSRTLVFNACADSSVTINYQITNCTGNPVGITGPTDPAFTITSNFSGGGVENISITYSGKVHTIDASDQILLTSPVIGANGGGSFTLTLIGHIRHDCGATSQILQCGVNNQSDSLQFGSVCPGQVYGPSCVPFINTTGSTITITLPVVPSPYTYTAMNDNGQTITASPYTVANGQSITVCVSINASAIQAYDTVLNFNFQCTGGKSGVFKIPLSAQAIKCNTCTCTNYFHSDITISENIKVGNDTTFTTEFFHNDLNCAVTVDNLKLVTQPTGWTIVSPLPTPAPIVPAGGNLQVTLKFKPGKAGKDNNELDFTITPTGSIAPCNGKTKVNGSGCNEACADVTMPAAYHVSPTVSKLDTLFLTQGGNDVFVSLPNAANVSDQECIKIHYADTACSSKQITIVPPRTSLFQVVTVPSPLTMLPGSDATVCVQFTAPQIQQVRKDFTLPGEEMKYTDVFSIIDPGCGTTTVPLKAVVDTLPACTDFTLTIYDATTVPQPLPYHQVFNYGNQQVIVSAPAGTIPSSGDLYLTNNSASPNLNITQPSNARGLFKWNNPPFNDVCANKQLVTQALQTLLAGGIAFNTAITGIAPNEIIVVSLGNNAYSVLLVNGVSPGANFNDLITHVAFRVLYPIFN